MFVFLLLSSFILTFFSFTAFISCFFDLGDPLKAIQKLPQLIDSLFFISFIQGFTTLY